MNKNSFVSSYKIESLIRGLRSLTLSILCPFQLVFGCFCLSCMRWNSHIRFSEEEPPWFTYLNKVYDWFEERLEIQAIANDITSKYVLPHVNIFYCLGGITLTCFLVQVATGFAMTFYYRSTITEAFASVQYIMIGVFEHSMGMLERCNYSSTATTTSTPKKLFSTFFRLFFSWKNYLWGTFYGFKCLDWLISSLRLYRQIKN